MLTDLQYRLLKKMYPGDPGKYMTGAVYEGKSKVRVLLGDALLERIKDRVVIDFGCGEGDEALDLARNGARKVIGIDVQERFLERARVAAAQAGLSSVCEFVRTTDEKAGIIVSIDAFEHFDDPAAILRTMDGLLSQGGEIIACFGPTWYHPLGGHLFSVFPWAHLVFTERALVRWRSDFKTDGATRFSEVAGGLNQMTVGRFEEIVAGSAFQFASFELVPIRKLASVHNRLTREFTSALVRCRLIRKAR